MKIDGEFVSVWDGGTEFRSPCTVDTEARTVEVHEIHEADVDVFDREFVVLEGQEFDATHESERESHRQRGTETEVFFYT